MCIYTHFRYLCLHDKLKIAHPCNKAALDPHGVLACPDDPSPQVDDGLHRTYTDRSYGVGICSSVHCAWAFSVLPLGDFGNGRTFDGKASFGDDTAMENSLEACDDRVGRWFHLLDVDQKLEHYSTTYPLPEHERSAAGNALLSFPYGAAVTPADSLKWQELNPQCLTTEALQWCVLNRILPASVCDSRKSATISPRKPIQGPFKVSLDGHACPKKHGICKTCGENVGDPALKESLLAHRQERALLAMWTEDAAKANPMGTSLDPSVDLKWDDAQGTYVKIASQNDDGGVQLWNAPAQTGGYGFPLDPALLFSDPDGSSGLLAGDIAPLTNGDIQHYETSDYSGCDLALDLPLPEPGLLAEQAMPFMDQAFGEMDLDLPPLADYSNAPYYYTLPDNLPQSDDLDAFSGPAADSLPTSEAYPQEILDLDFSLLAVSDEPVAQQVEAQVQSALAQRTSVVSEQTVGVLRRMLRQAMGSGGVANARLSYDWVADEMFEQVVQQKIAGLIQ